MKISKEKLKYLLDEENVSLMSIRTDRDVKIEGKMSIYFNFDDLGDKRNGTRLKEGFIVTYDNKSYEPKDFEELSHLLCLDEQKEIELVSINNRFKTIDAYLENKEFNNLNMQGILDRYGEADAFELVSPYNKNFEFLGVKADENIGGIDDAVSGLRKSLLSELKDRFNKYQDKIKESTTKDFDAIIDDITNEILKAKKKRKGIVFLCDKVYEGKTKYVNPVEFFWHAYHSVTLIIECQENAKKQLEQKVEIEESVLSDLKYLQPHMISAKLSYSWHCTTSSALSVVFRFELNDETKKYLLRFKDDYALRGLEDLALYKGDKLLFSSCTHEGFHNDGRNAGEFI